MLTETAAALDGVRVRLSWRESCCQLAWLVVTAGFKRKHTETHDISFFLIHILRLKLKLEVSSEWQRTG